MQDNSPIKLTIPRVGMKMIHPSLLKPENYSLLVNGNIQSVGDSFALITNELSNILCSRFKEGYKVINVQPVLSLNLTFFFLVNPNSDQSEIGIIYNAHNKDRSDKEVFCKDCAIGLKEDVPLEQQEQTESCTYITFVSAECLNFNINFPVKSWVKVDDCNVRLYFTDDLNNIRYIDYDNYQKETLLTCPKVYSNELDCDKIKIFKDACYPKISYADIVSGGQNNAGTYQFSVAYSDVNSNPLTPYFYTTNPIPLGDLPIVSPSDPQYPVAKSIKLHIEGLNTDFDYFNIVVLKTVNGNTTSYLAGTFANSNTTFDYVYSGIDKNLLKDVSVDELLKRTPKYTKAKGIAESNGYLFFYDLEEPRTINLQPVINKLSLKWQTEILNEGDYKNPIIAANYKTQLRDEVYPYAIEFTRTNSPATPRFHIPGREATPYDLEDVTQITLNNTLTKNPDVFASDLCATTPSGNPRWTVYNTATPSGYACGFTPSEDCDIKITGDFICKQGVFYQDINNKKYYSDYDPNATPQLFNEVIPCETFTCKVNLEETDDCYKAILQNYPGTTPSGVTFDSCSYEITQLGYTKQVPHFNPDGNILYYPGSYPEINPSGVITNTTCLTAINLASYSCSSDTASSYLTKFDNPGNSLWYSFVAGQPAMVINLISPYNIYEGNTYTITVYKTTANPPCDNLSILTGYPITTSNPYLFIDGLNQGDTYYISIDATSVNPTAGVDDYYYICQTTPTPAYYTTESVPNYLTLVCNYKVKYCLKKDPCKGVPYQFGNFSYWESQETYPCNEELYGDLAGMPIRHHKFPDCAISPYYQNNKGATALKDLYTLKNNIYPIGVIVDVKEIKQLLLDAVAQGLITEEERLSICGYRILRGNRRGNESIIAKGLLYDVWEYPDNVYNSQDTVLYPNYPYNPKTPDVFNRKTKIKSLSNVKDDDGNLLNDPIYHPYYDKGLINNKYTFHSPNTHFNNPGLGNEIKLELEAFGASEGQFSEVKAHAKYQYTGVGMFQAAWGFSCAESFVETVQLVSQASATPVGVLGSFVGISYILAIVSVNIGAPGLIFSHYYEWLDILQKFAPFRNYAWYYTSVGNYSDFTLNNIVPGNRRRLLAEHQYLNSGILSVKADGKNKKLNNIKRESSVYLNLNDVDNDPTSIYSSFIPTSKDDNSRWFPGDNKYNPVYGGTTSCDNIGNIYSNISSYYASIKNQLPSQYGQLNNIEYIDTGYNGVIDWNDDNQETLCDTIFGGDTYINKFYLRTQFPFFLSDAVGLSPNSDITYSQLGNVGFPQFYLNYPTSSDSDSSTSAIYGNIAMQGLNNVDYNFSCEGSTGDALFWAGATTGITSAIAAGTSLSIGLGVTYGVVKTILENQTDGHAVFLKGRIFLYAYGEPGFMVESDYNLDLRNGQPGTKDKDFYPHVGDMVTWTQPTGDYNIINYDNTYFLNRDLLKQNKENFGFSLRPDFNQVKEDCKASHPNRLIYSLQDNDNNDRFDGNLVYPANNFYDFPKSGGKVKLVFGSNSSKVVVLQEDQCSIFNSYITTENQQILQATVGTNQIFNPNIPSQYIKTDLGYAGSQTSAYVSTEFGSYWVDNKRGQIFNYGETIQNIISEENAWWFKENLPFQILRYFPNVDIDNAFKYFGMSVIYDQRFKRILFTKKDYKPHAEFKDKIKFSNNVFTYNDAIIEPTNSTYFCDCSFTIGYSPLQKEFISFYSYTPNYYVSSNSYFSSGINYSEDKSEFGLWNHSLNYSSYQVFYGKIYPFLFQYSLNGYNNEILQSISYKSEFRRYTNELNFFVKNDVTYSNAEIWNQNQTSGTLNLTIKQPNNLLQQISYPKQNGNSTDILVSNVENIFRFNQFYDVSLQNGYPLMTYECNPVYPQVNLKAISYQPTFLKNSLRGDYFNVRLINNKLSNYQIIHQFNLNQETPSQT